MRLQTSPYLRGFYLAFLARPPVFTRSEGVHLTKTINFARLPEDRTYQLFNSNCFCFGPTGDM